MLLTRVYAVPIDASNISDPLGGKVSHLSNVFGLGINLLIGVGWAMAFVSMGLGIIKYIMSKGDPKETATATSWLLFTAVGAVILMLITVLRKALFGLIGVDDSWGIANISTF